MPSFDVVSEVDQHELNNAIDQTNREITTRFDFKGTDSRVSYKDNIIAIDTGSDFQVQQIIDILNNKVVKRGIDLDSLKAGEVTETNNRAKLEIQVQEGLDQDIGRKLVKQIKQSKMKIQAAIQGDKVRISGKKRDDLQSAMQLIKDMDLGIPVQFNNFRD